jgi:hypothetical protein
MEKDAVASAVSHLFCISETVNPETVVPLFLNKVFVSAFI